MIVSGGAVDGRLLFVVMLQYGTKRNRKIFFETDYTSSCVTGASCQRQGKYKDAIKYHTMVLTISHMTRESSGNTEAYGAIADCYTELGDLETAGKFYDKYIDGLEQDD